MPEDPEQDAVESVHIPVDPEGPVRVFEVAMRGYRRDEVDAYVRETERELAELRFLAETARTEPEQVRRERTALESLRSEFAAEQADWQPSFTALGRRAEQILELAQAEADDLMHATQRDIGHVRERAMRECDDLRRRALAAAAVAEQKGQSALAAARAEAERLTVQATKEIATSRAAAADEATGAVNTARISATELLDAARAEAERLLESTRDEVAALVRERADLLAQLGVLAERMQALANPAPRGEPKAIRPA